MSDILTITQFGVALRGKELEAYERGAAAERERCAKIAERLHLPKLSDKYGLQRHQIYEGDVAAAIREGES